MIRRALLPVAAGVLLLGGVPALADANGSTEQRTEPRSCGAAPDNRYSPPAEGDCQGGATTYQATYYSNDVRCGDTNAVTPTDLGTTVYAGGDPTADGGGVGLCSDGTGPEPAPVQGRAGLSGSTSDGARLVVDGDKDNAAPNGNETAQGYVLVEKPAGAQQPTVRCGDEARQGGRADSDSPQERDTQGECASGS
jgi:hypothetical protein